MSNTEFVVSVAMGRFKYEFPKLVIHEKSIIQLGTIDKDYSNVSITNCCEGTRSNGKPDCEKLYWGIEINGNRIAEIRGDIDAGELASLLATIIDAHICPKMYGDFTSLGIDSIVRSIFNERE